MSQRLFNTAKVGVFLETWKPGIEKRRGEEVKVLVLSCTIQPFDAKLATALDSGVGGDSNVRATVFSLNTSDAKPHFTGYDFVLGLVRQTMEIFASPDTKQARMALTQVKIAATSVKVHKDNPNSLQFNFKASFGPVGRDEMELLHEWFRGQKFVTFQEAEKSLEFEEADTDAEADEEDDDPPAKRRPKPDFDTTADGRPVN